MATPSALHQRMIRPGWIVSKGLARACEPVFSTPPTQHTGPKGCTEGAPQIPDRGGGSEGEACLTLHLGAPPQVGLDDAAVGADLLRRPLGDLLAVVEHHDPP